MFLSFLKPILKMLSISVKNGILSSINLMLSADFVTNLSSSSDIFFNSTLLNSLGNLTYANNWLNSLFTKRFSCCLPVTVKFR